MASILMCPEEADLLALAMGEPIAAAVTAHVAKCASCRAKVDRFRAEAASLRQNYGNGTSPPSTEPDPAVDHDGEPPNAGTTRDWTPADPAGAPGTDPLGPEAVAAARDRAEGQGDLPDAIGKYKVVGWLDGGGEADVYRVVHITLGNDLVLKLSRRPVGADNQSGLVAEGRLLVDLQHPNLVRIYDLDFHDDRPFLVMEYVHGRNLEDYARDEPVAPRRAAALVAKLADVMAVAHRHGITHCDIKPKNILIDQLGEPRVIDFGMARLRHAWSDRAPSSWGGTYAYMAPEQARLEIDRIGPRSDIFALGGVLYFLLTGEAPFVGQTGDEVWDRARRCDFEAGALRLAKAPRRLERICLKAMAADPADRYSSAELLQKALKRYIAKPRVQAALAGVIGLALLASALYALAKRTETQPALPGASSPVAARPLASSIPAPPVPIKGRINLLVVNSKDGTRRRLRLQDPGAVPVRAKDQVRIEARLDRPAYLYLFWISSNGKVAPLYPWKDHDWSQRPLDERKVKDAELPEIFDEVLDIPVSAPGMETLVLLAREQTPLPRGDEGKLAQLLAGASMSSALDLAKPIWIEDGEEVAFEPSAAAGRDRSGDDTLTRGIPSPKARKSDDPVLRIRALLNEKVKPLGSYSQAVLFPNQGGS
ncbi:MAG: protein kinase [Isosphaerales bacterium]